MGGGEGYAGHVISTWGSGCGAALQRAEELGAKRLLGPVENAQAKLAVGHFADPEGHVVGVAGPAQPGTE